MNKNVFEFNNQNSIPKESQPTVIFKVFSTEQIEGLEILEKHGFNVKVVLH